MKYSSQLMIALMSASLLAPHAMAESQQPRIEKFPDVKSGDRFSYVNGVFLIRCNRWEVKDANKNGEIVSKCGDNTLYVTADSGNPVMAVNEKGETVAKFTPFYPELSFPLFVGKKWSGKYKAHQGRTDWSGDMTCESTAFEEVRVAAGKFNAFRIECANKWDSGILFINGTKKSTSWYAPEINLIIRSVNEDSKWSYEVAGTGWL